MTRPPILVAVDFSTAGRRAFEAAKRLALDYDTRLIIAHAYPKPIYVSVAAGDETEEMMREHQAGRSKQEALELAESWVQTAKEEGIDAVGAAGDGPPADFILKTARSENAALIVVGTHARKGIRHLLLGSVAAEVTRKSHRPVLVVPPAASE